MTSAQQVRNVLLDEYRDLIIEDQDDGSAVVRCNIPSFREGTAAVIISAQSPIGNDEVKQLVKRRK